MEYSVIENDKKKRSELVADDILPQLTIPSNELRTLITNHASTTGESASMLVCSILQSANSKSDQRKLIGALKRAFPAPQFWIDALVSLPPSSARSTLISSLQQIHNDEELMAIEGACKSLEAGSGRLALVKAVAKYRSGQGDVGGAIDFYEGLEYPEEKLATLRVVAEQVGNLRFRDPVSVPPEYLKWIKDNAAQFGDDEASRITNMLEPKKPFTRDDLNRATGNAGRQKKGE